MRFDGVGARLALTSKTDLEVLNEVLVLREYALELREPPRTILDLGSHIGATLLFFRATYPEARIVGVEADPLTFAVLERNAARLAAVTVHHAAVAAHDGHLSFVSADQPWVSSVPQGPAAPGAGGETVPGRRIDSLMRETGLDTVDLLKIDVEGAEVPALRAFDGLARVGTVVGEFHGGADELASFVALLGTRRVTVTGGAGHYGFHAGPPLPDDGPVAP